MTTAISTVPKELMEPWTFEVQSITTEEDRIDVGAVLSDNKSFQKKVKAYFGPLKKAAKAVHSDVCDKEKAFLCPAMVWESNAKMACMAYDDEQERLRRIEQRKLEAEALKREEEEKQAIVGALEAEAVSYEQVGEADKAEELREEAAEVEAEPVMAPVVVAPVTAPIIQGHSISITYKAEVLNLMELVKAVVDGRVSIMAIKADTVFLNQQARSLKETMNVPGVKVTAVKNMAVRGR